MTIGVALLLLAAGAILRFAITTVVADGVNLRIVGDILMAVGGLGLVIWIGVWMPWTRGRHGPYPPPTPPPPRDDQHGTDPYRTDKNYQDRPLPRGPAGPGPGWANSARRSRRPGPVLAEPPGQGLPPGHRSLVSLDTG
jgi:hypothetical protein